MSFLFGGSKTPQEMMREHQRLIRRSIGEMERERAALERQEQRVIVEIKKMAQQGRMGATRIMAKDLVRIRGQAQKYYQMISYMQTMNMRLQTLRSTASMAQAMRGVTSALVRMNRSLNLPGMQAVTMEFQRQSELMDMKNEMMEETMDDMFELDDTEEDDPDDIVDQVLDEIGINVGTQMSEAPAPAANNIPVLPTELPRRTMVAEDDRPSTSEADIEIMSRIDRLHQPRV